MPDQPDRPPDRKRDTVTAAALISLLTSYATAKAAENHWSALDALILLGLALSFWLNRRR